MEIIFFVILTISIIIFLYVENNQLQVTSLVVESNKIPASFHGYRIVHLSDLHNKQFGRNQGNIIKKINKIHPDAIFVTGDLIDRRRYHPEISLELIKQLTSIYPIYYVTGNHERFSNQFEELEKELQKYHVHLLRNSATSLTRAGQKINLIGLDDPSFAFDDSFYEEDNEQNEQNEITVIEDALDEIKRSGNWSDYNILLAHRPEYFSIYQSKGIDVTFSGHAHGGQIAIPGVGGILAPSQGFFPKYVKGLHYKNGSNLVVSRGLGNSLFPQRLFNKPEIVVVTLSRKSN